MILTHVHGILTHLEEHVLWSLVWFLRELNKLVVNLLLSPFTALCR